MSNSSNVTSNSTFGCGGFLMILTLIFITLKLTGFITWTWFWVLSPLFLWFGILGLILAVFLIAALVAYFLK